MYSLLHYLAILSGIILSYNTSGPLFHFSWVAKTPLAWFKYVSQFSFWLSTYVLLVCELSRQRLILRVIINSNMCVILRIWF